MTKARELAELAKAVTVVDNQIDVDRVYKKAFPRHILSTSLPSFCY